MRSAKLMFLLCLSQTASLCLAASLKIRAREHFEIHKVSTEKQDLTYRGLSNTINVWLETPYKVSYGLALSPLLGSAKTKDTPIASLSEEIKLISVGGEVKFFPFDILGDTFGRVGCGWTQLRTEGTLKNPEGHHLYVGLGYEIRIMKAGLALEAGFRSSTLADDIKVESVTPSIGLHFYEMI